MIKRFNPLIISSIVLAILTGVVFYKTMGDEEKIEKFFGTEDIDIFCFDEVCISKNEDKWFLINNELKMPANSETAEIYQEKLKQISLKELVSQNPEKFGEMGIGGEMQNLLKINNFELEIGNIASDYSGTYVREKNAEEIYKIDLILDRATLFSADKWKLKYLTNFPKIQIKKISGQIGDKRVEMEKKEDKWPNEEMVETLSYLKVTDVADFKINSDMEYLLTAETEGEQLLLWVGENKDEKNKTNYWASADKTYFFTISKEEYDLLTGWIR